MKHGHAMAIGLLALTLVACGGKGENHGSNLISNSGEAANTDYRIEAVLTNPPSDSSDPYVYQDPQNIQVNDNVTFELVDYTGSASNPVRHVVAYTGDPATGVVFQTNAPEASGIQLTAAGQLSAPTKSTDTQYTVTASYQGNIYGTKIQIHPETKQIRLLGRVLFQGSGDPVYNATIDFYEPSDINDPTSTPNRVATVHTAINGTFRASIPGVNDNVRTAADVASAVPLTFTIRREKLPTGTGHSFVFEGSRYVIGDDQCRALAISHVPTSDSDTTYLPFRSGVDYLVQDGFDGLPASGLTPPFGTIELATTTTEEAIGATDANGNTIADGCPASDTSPRSAMKSLGAALKGSKG